MKKCPNCGKECNDDMKFCPNCGSELDDNTCKNCGKKIDPSWKVCPYCRNEINSHTFNIPSFNQINNAIIDNILDENRKKKPYQENGTIYINFGKFPQTHIGDKKLVENILKYASISSEGYYEYEGSEYVRLNANTKYDWYLYSDGTKVENKEEWFKVEPIKWRVLSNQNHNLIVMSEYLLNSMAFSRSDNDNNDYDKSAIREWLNNEFYDKSFTNEEKGKIIRNNEVYNDKVWLLSLDDIKNSLYRFNIDEYSPDEVRIGKATDYALAKGASISMHNRVANWFLRSHYPDYSFLEQAIMDDGSIDNILLSKIDCVRPALIIELN